MLTELLLWIEEELKGFYQLSHEHSVLDHLVTTTDTDHRAATLFTQTDDTMFIGVFYRPDLVARLEYCHPCEALSTENLDTFSVIAEEAIHFHHIIDRVLKGQPLSQLELEFQAEVDKVLLAGILLHEQTGDPHYGAVTRMQFEHHQVKCDGPTIAARYEEANRYAARLWYDLMTHGDGLSDPRNSKYLLDFLRRCREAHWQEKIRLIESLRAQAFGA